MCYNILRISEYPKTNRRKVECNMKLITRLLALLTALTLLAVSGLAETVTTQDQIVATVNGTPLYLTELLIGEKSQKMYLVLHAVSGGVAFQPVAQIACACDEKLTALYLCKGAEKHVNALVIDKSACEEHLDAVLVSGSFGEHGTALYGEVLLGYDTIGENSALVRKFGQIQ